MSRLFSFVLHLDRVQPQPQRTSRLVVCTMVDCLNFNLASTCFQSYKLLIVNPITTRTPSKRDPQETKAKKKIIKRGFRCRSRFSRARRSFLLLLLNDELLQSLLQALAQSSSLPLGTRPCALEALST